jgi:YD repeat-containing protein
MHFQNKENEAVEALKNYVALGGEGNATNYLWQLDGAGIEQLKIEYFWKLIDRNSVDGERLADFAEYKGRWMGSQLSALWAYERMKEVAPSYMTAAAIDSREAQLYSNLGDSNREVRKYLTGTSISDSDRYIGWFKNARLTAERGSRQIKFDAKNIRAEIQLESGETEIVQEDLRTGKPTLMQIGAAYLRAKYDERGNLVSVSDAGHHEVKLTYDRNDRIATLRTADGRNVHFTYNNADKPIVIDYEGIGAINVTYNAHNEIDKVESSAGRAVALKVTSAFQELLDLIRPFASRYDTTRLPVLPFDDPALDALQEKLQQAEEAAERTGAGPAARAARGDARLGLVRYLMAHVADRQSYLNSALDTVKGAIDAGRDRNAVPAERDTAGEAVVLWHDLMRESRKEGLTKDEWQYWMNLQNWVAAMEREHKGFSHAVTELLAGLPNAPLRLLPAAMWLPRSSLTNPGMWRRFPVAEILPGNLRDARLSTVLARRNGDVVVGGTAGLHVLRRGYWEHFGFNLGEHHFSGTISSKDAQEFGALALAEDDDGVLWVGTSSGLLAVPGDYTDAAKLWRVEDGLGAPRVDHLVAFGSGVLAGGANGLARVTIRGAEPAAPQTAIGSTPVAALRAMPPMPVPAAEPLIEPLELVASANGIQAQVAGDKIRIGRKGKLMRTVPRSGHDGIGFTPNEAAYVTFSPGHGIELWPVNGNAPAIVLPVSTGFDGDLEVAMAASGTVLIAISEEHGKIAFWRLSDRQEQHVDFPKGVRNPSIGLTPDGRYLVIAWVNGVQWLDIAGAHSPYRAVIPENCELEGVSRDHSSLVLRGPNGQARQITLADGATVPATTPARALLATDRGIYLVTPAAATQLDANGADDLYWDEETNQLFVLRGREILAGDWDGSSGRSPPLSHLLGQQDVVFSNVISGFASFPLDGQKLLAVLTDRGLSLWRDAHFEHFSDFPHKDETVAVSAMASAGDSSRLLTSEGIYLFERGQAIADTDGSVSGILSIPQAGVVAIARGDRLEVIRDDDQTAHRTTLASIGATVLAVDADGRLLTNDGLTTLRYDADLGHSQELFSAKPDYKGKSLAPAQVTSLLVARDKTVWVTAGASVFHYDGSTTTEYSALIDPVRNPIWSDMLSRVVETFDGRIWVVASNEGHRNVDGIALRGGLFEFTGEGFKRLDLSDHTNWFVTGYTQISDGAAIVGTTDGFVEHRTDRYAGFAQLNDSTYAALQARMPALYLGRRGARLGQDTWLFGTARGIVGYRAGKWFLPDRLNWMLPDFGKQLYGAHTVHAIAVDGAGRIYAGTDIGLLVYGGGGGDPFGFLIGENMGSEVFTDLEREKLAREAEILVKAAPPNSQMRKAVDNIARIQKRREEIKAALAPGRLMPAPTDPGGRESSRLLAPALAEDEHKHLESEEKLLDRQYIAELAKIEREQPVLRRELEIKPLDLAAMRHELAETPWAKNSAIVQYMAASRRLYIHVITREVATIRQVEVSADEIFKRSAAVGQALARRATMAVTSPEAAPQNRGGVPVLLPGAATALTLPNDLAWLYQVLLRPIEGELEGHDHVFIVPYKQLTYVPFAALIRTLEPKIEYAIQRYNIGYLPSLYLLDLMLHHEQSANTDVLALGDPQDDLAGARQEAKLVAQLTNSGLPALVGKAASRDAILSHAQQVRWIHFATHGFLNPEAPEESYLILANRYRLQIGEVFDMPLGQVDGVVLSGCDTGLGTDGAEFSTLAFAFAHARVPTVIATLWRIDDAASEQLMEKFYEYQGTHDSGDVFTALVQAQRAMLKSPPSQWAGYIVLGKP